MNKVYSYFRADSAEIKLIHRSINHSQKADGYICLIGLSNGDIMDNVIYTLMKLNIKYRIIVAVDPYGSIAHHKKESLVENNNKFSNNVRNYSVTQYYNKLSKYNIQGTYIQLDSREFIKRYTDGIPYYYKQRD